MPKTDRFLLKKSQPHASNSVCWKEGGLPDLEKRKKITFLLLSLFYLLMGSRRYTNRAVDRIGRGSIILFSRIHGLIIYLLPFLKFKHSHRFFSVGGNRAASKDESWKTQHEWEYLRILTWCSPPSFLHARVIIIIFFFSAAKNTGNDRSPPKKTFFKLL